MDETKKNERMTNFFFEIGTMRKLNRMHSQILLSNDYSDTIASHTYRVAMIGWFLAQNENADPYKVFTMCLCHDMNEVRSNYHNWVHKKYVKVFDDEIMKDQLGTLLFTFLHDITREYKQRETHEAKISKDVDLLDEVLLLREYEMQSNTEATLWLKGKNSIKDDRKPTYYALLYSDTRKN